MESRTEMVQSGRQNSRLASAISIGSSPYQSKQQQQQQRRQYSTLPKLPVPPLKQTLSLFLRNIRPVVPPESFKNAEKAVNEFMSPSGDGEKLQAFLEKRAETHNNWLSQWWLEKAYLDLRCPTPVNISPALSFPLQNFKNKNEWLAYTARLTRGLLHYKQMIDNDEVKPDMAGKSPLDMKQYQLLFGTNRRPGIGRDVMLYGKDRYPSPKHIVVAHNEHFFRVQVMDDTGSVLNEDQIMAQLHICEQESVHPADTPLGIMTTEDRDVWGKVYNNIRNVSAKNKAHLEDIESSLFLICLDRAPNFKDSRLNELHRQLIHGGGSKSNAGNRWYDKTLQFCIGEDGMSGITYEHSPAEGPPVASLMDFVMDYMLSERLESAAPGIIEKPKMLEFDLSKEEYTAIQKAAEHHDKIVANLEVEMVQFKQFGKNFPKSVKLSPDSFCQLAFQLTYFKMHGSHPPTYETGTLRMFDEGRTDTIRLPSDASVEWVHSMREPSTSHSQRSQLLRAAVDSHKKYTLAAMTGNGMDRHMLGLKLAAGELNVPIPALLQHPAYQRLLHFNLSTSQVPTKHEALMAFGPAYDDCYGICYNPQETQINVSVSAYNSCPDTSALKFKNALEETFLEMKTTLENDQKSKL